jgi:hypothetical protein
LVGVLNELVWLTVDDRRRKITKQEAFSPTNPPPPVRANQTLIGHPDHPEATELCMEDSRNAGNPPPDRGRSRSFVKSEADPPDRDARADRDDSCGKRLDTRETPAECQGVPETA